MKDELDKLPTLTKALDLMYDEEAETYSLPTNVDPEGPIISADEIERLEHEKEDYSKARAIYKTVADKGMQSLDLLTTIADATQEPRAFEVIATLIKSLNETAKQMRELHVIGKPISKFNNIKETKAKDESSNINVEKALFVGSPTELLKAMNDANKT